MALFFMMLPLFLSLGSKSYSFSPFIMQTANREWAPSEQAKERIHSMLTECLTQNPSILENALLKNPHILARFFKKHPSIFWDAQQNMIENFSENVSHSIQKSTERILKNSPELWGNMQKKPITVGKKTIILFLDPLCPHSIGLFRDMLSLARTEHTPLSLCPHWITQHDDINSQIVVRSLIAAHTLGKLEAYLDLLLGHVGHLSAGFALTLAKKIGADVKEFHTTMFSSDTDQHLTDARSYGNQFQFPGFPTMMCQKESTSTGPQNSPSFDIIEGRPDSLQSLSQWLFR